MNLAALLARVAPTVLVGAAAVLTTGCGEYYYDSPPVAYAQAPETGVVYGQAGDGVTVEGSANVADDGATVDTADGADVEVGADADEYADTDPAALSDFRTTLDPYGTWVDDETYGTVWVPSVAVVGADFAPYVTAGHWVYGDDYVWASDYDWGWAPFHYGRWVYVASRGWAWIPGREYAGAWVSWRVGPDGYDYVGWGPMAPTWYWRGGIAYRFGFDLDTPYTFCDRDDLFDEHVGRRVIAGPRVRTVAARTRPWTPARPGVGGPHRTAASPQVGPPHHGASPARGPMGPPPSSLGLQASRIARAPASNAGLARALAFSRPSTATRFGARAPQRFVASGVGHPAYHSTTIGRQPDAYSRPVATAPRYMQNGQVYQSPIPAQRPTPVYRAPQDGSPVYRSSSGPTYRTPEYTRPAQTYRAPQFDNRPTQTYRAPVQRTYQAPAYRAPSGQAYHAPSRSYGSTYHAPSSGSSSSYSSSHHYAAPSHSGGSARHR